jgi:hypothetical protein
LAYVIAAEDEVYASRAAARAAEEAQVLQESDGTEEDAQVAMEAEVSWLAADAAAAAAREAALEVSR